MQTFLRIFFHYLYHQFAFAYDFVAGVVSFGRWKDWILEVVPFIEGIRILEIGPGPGHLQRFLLNRRLTVVAVDESAPMLQLAKHNTDDKANLIRGLAQHLPFANRSFDTVITTFPTEYISDAYTLSEVKRCLSDGGRLVVLPAAMPKNRFLSWLFRVTGQDPSDATETIQGKLEEPFTQSGFKITTHVIKKPPGTLIIFVAQI